MTASRRVLTFADIEVHLAPEKEAKLQQLATRTGKNEMQVVEEAVDRLLEYDAHFIEAVERVPGALKIPH